MITVTSTFAGTVQALAAANGPYVVDAAVPLTFTGDPDRPDTTYDWDFGDGATATGRIATHAYADNGIFVAKLTTTVNQAGGVVTREFAQVRVRNVPPTVDAGAPLTVDEGSELEVVATFTDPEWPDTHRAYFQWGDDTPPTEGTVNESNAPPSVSGTARAKHTWCDSGMFTVTVQVEDDDGGVGTSQVAVEVRNVPPTVDAGPDLFAYRCTPLNLVGRFTDPGWCDTHTGSWDFGDCTPVQPATVVERHEPPAGTGVVIATHRYDTCGEFYATCVVVDDDGGRGDDSLVVRVVDVRNGGSEGGFRHLTEGVVANEWEPYVGAAPGPIAFAPPHQDQPVPSPKAGVVAFAAEEFVVHSGQRSQRIVADGAFTAGIWQRVGANPKWDYQVTGWYQIDERTSGTVRLGIDPTGGDDPTSGAIVWSEGGERHAWTQLATRAAARARALTIFIEARSDQPAVAWFDDIELVPFPCPAPEPAPPSKPDDPGREVEKCVDWRDEKEPRRLGTRVEKDGFTFAATKGAELRIVTWGSPPDEGKLALPDRGIDVQLPGVSETVVATIAVHTHDPVAIIGMSADGRQVAAATSTARTGNMDRVTLEGGPMESIHLSGGGDEALLIRLCVYSRSEGEARPDVAARADTQRSC